MLQEIGVNAGSLEKNIFEHISMMAQEQIEVEMREEIQQLMMLQQQIQQNPQMGQNPQVQQQMMQMSMAMESRKAKLIAESTEEFRDEAMPVKFWNDPIAKLKSRELDLRAMDDVAKREQEEQKINMEKSKNFMGQQQFDEKMDQNEELAELRADTSLEKTQMGIDAKRQQDRPYETNGR